MTRSTGEGAPAAGATERAGRGRLTRRDVVEAALRVADAEGLERLTIRRVAGALGVVPMALYTHVRDKDALLQAMADSVLAGIDIPPSGAPPRDRPEAGAPGGGPGGPGGGPQAPWRRLLREAAGAFRRGLVRHPGAVPLFVAYASFGPEALRLQEAILSTLVGSGLSPPDAVRAYQAVLTYTTGFVVLEVPRTRGQPGGPPGGPPPPRLAGTVPMELPALTTLPAALYPTTVGLAPLLAAGAGEAQFVYGLERLLDGIGAALQGGAAAPAGPRRSAGKVSGTGR